MNKINNLDKQYLDLVQDIIDNGHTKNDRTGTGTISVFGRQIRHKMSEGFPLLTTKKMHWKSIVSELIWFLRGDTNIKWLLEQGNTIWVGDAYKNYCKSFENQPILDIYSFDTDPITLELFIEKVKHNDDFAKKWGNLGPIYGSQWRDWKGFIQGWNSMADTEYPYDFDTKGIDQITKLINDLKNNPDSRRLMVNAWNVGELDSMVLPPCHYGFQVYTRELSIEERNEYYTSHYKGLDETREKLDKMNIPSRAISLMYNQRSVDTGLGLPFNIASYGLLLEIIAKAVNMVPDELIGNLGDVHLYSNHVEPIKEQFRKPFPLPTLSINTEFWPTESGECGVGPISALSVFNSFSDDNFCKCLLEDDIQLVNYQSHPTIKLPLSN